MLQHGLLIGCIAGIVSLGGTATAHAPAERQGGAPAAAAQRGTLPSVHLRTSGPILNSPRRRVRVRVNGRGEGGYLGWGAIEIRGQSSQLFPKKSYALELQASSGANRDASLVGMAADDDWVLYAAYNDKTLMRNVLAYAVARRMGRWAADTRFVEVFHNGRYEGVYVLMERPELNGARIDVEGDGLTGDYLLEFTFNGQLPRKAAAFFRTPIQRRPILYEDPERQDLSAREARYVRGVVNSAERALYRGRRGAWRKRLDEAAAVDYVLIQELFRNVDAFHGSVFLTKPADARLQLGPVWDFDLSTGNSNASTSRFTQGWWTRSRDWAERLHDDRGFRKAMYARWRELRAAGFRRFLLRSVDASARAARPGVDRNFRRWPVLHRRIWTNPRALGSYGAEVRFLRRWLSRRMQWLDRAAFYHPT